MRALFILYSSCMHGDSAATWGTAWLSMILCPAFAEHPLCIRCASYSSSIHPLFIKDHLSPALHNFQLLPCMIIRLSCIITTSPPPDHNMHQHHYSPTIIALLHIITLPNTLVPLPTQSPIFLAPLHNHHSNRHSPSSSGISTLHNHDPQAE
jgi:hypothetical protein